jgi:hypothetical protein
MLNLLNLASWVGLLFLLALFVIVVVRAITGHIQVHGLLHGTASDGTRFASAGRSQLLIATAWVAANCVSQVVQNPGKFPDISQNYLLFFGGSHLFYLGSKYYSLRRD